LTLLYDIQLGNEGLPTYVTATLMTKKKVLLMAAVGCLSLNSVVGSGLTLRRSTRPNGLANPSVCSINDEGKTFCLSPLTIHLIKLSLNSVVGQPYSMTFN
jgi:hypothetical protein